MLLSQHTACGSGAAARAAASAASALAPPRVAQAPAAAARPHQQLSAPPAAATPCVALPSLAPPLRGSTLLCRAASGEDGPQQEPPTPSGKPDESGVSEVEQLKRKFFGGEARPGSPPASRRPSSPATSRRPSPTLTRSATPPGEAGDANPLDSVNPYALGRQARKAFDEVWSQLSNLGSPTKSFLLDDVLEPPRDVEFEAPQAAYTTVLVVGATGRVGRILIRKLLLRGYQVRALVRPKREGGKQRDEYTLPAAVEVVEGELGDSESCQRAVRGCNKVRGTSHTSTISAIASSAAARSAQTLSVQSVTTVPAGHFLRGGALHLHRRPHPRGGARRHERRQGAAGSALLAAQCCDGDAPPLRLHHQAHQGLPGGSGVALAGRVCAPGAPGPDGGLPALGPEPRGGARAPAALQQQEQEGDCRLFAGEPPLRAASSVVARPLPPTWVQQQQGTAGGCREACSWRRAAVACVCRHGRRVAAAQG